MNEEKMIVLRMLAESKISADEAARLLEALGEESAKEPAEEHWGFPFESVARGARHAMRHAAKAQWRWPMGDWVHHEDPFQAGFDTTPQTIAVKEGMTLQVNNVMGSIKLVGTSEPEIVVQGGPRRHYRIDQQGQNVTVQTHRMGTGLTIRVPVLVDKVIVHSNLGEIAAQNLANDDVQLSTNMGGILFDAEAVKTGTLRLRSDVGAITLRLPADAACEIRATCDNVGEVSFDADAPLEVLEQGAGFLHGKLGGGGADIRLMTHTGEIRVKIAD